MDSTAGVIMQKNISNLVEGKKIRGRVPTWGLRAEGSEIKPDILNKVFTILTKQSLFSKIYFRFSKKTPIFQKKKCSSFQRVVVLCRKWLQFKENIFYVEINCGI